jgi:hypothetical protein
MLTCPNCGSDNRYGAIFCRGCGKKLDVIDEITVENIDEKTGGKKRKRRKEKGALTPKQLHTKSMIINAIRIVVILLIGFAVYLTQQTPTVSAIPTSKAAKDSFDNQKRKLRAGEGATITEKQLNSYLAAVLPRVEPGKMIKFENLQIALGNEEDKEEIAVRMYARVFGKRMLFQMFGKLEKDDGKVKFSPSTFGKLGKLPYPAFLVKLHCKNVLKNLEKDKELFDRLTDATIDEVKVRRNGKTVPTSALKLKPRAKS